MGRLNRVFTGMLLLSALLESGAQSKTTAFSEKFEAYQSLWPKTKLHLIVNQDKFSPGDTIWFKAYLLTEELTGVAGKQLIDVNLVDSQGRSTLHMTFNVFNGTGHNQLIIPDTLVAGNYLITAHSSWMKNFDPAYFFKKEIKIVRKNRLTTYERPEITIAAEGGHLIRDIPNKVSIRTNRPGASIRLLDAAGQKLDSTATDLNGVATFIITPERIPSHYVQLAGDATRVPLPPGKDGYALRLMPTEGGKSVKIMVTAPPDAAFRREELILIVSSRGRIHHSATFRQGKREFVEVQLQNFPEGITYASLLDKAGNVHASRVFYSPGMGSAKAKIETVKDTFHTREKVQLQVSLTNAQGQPVAGEFSVRVLHAALFDRKTESTLIDELTIFSELKERFLIDRNDPKWQTHLDNYLITVSEPLPWKEMLSKRMEKPTHSSTERLRKRGRAYVGKTNEPVPESTRIMFYLQKQKMRYQVLTSKNGEFELEILDVYGQDELFYMAQTEEQELIRDLKIVWGRDSIKLPRPLEAMETDSPDRYASFTKKNRLISRSYHFYTSPDGAARNPPIAENNQAEAEIAEADVTIKVRDYIVFATMEELIKEVIRPLVLGRKDGKRIVLVNFIQPPLATGHPLYIIDGIATTNTDFFLSLKPEDLLTIGILRTPRKLAHFGLMGQNGVVMVQTRMGFVREPLDDQTKLIEGISKPLSFQARDHSGEGSQQIPDFRSTIYWDPSVNTDPDGKASVEFFCSDDVGSLSIRIDGITIGGEPFSAYHEVVVKF